MYEPERGYEKARETSHCCLSPCKPINQGPDDIASNMFGQRLSVNSSRDRSSSRPQQRIGMTLHVEVQPWL